MAQKKVSFKNSNNGHITMSAVVNFPKGFDEKKNIPLSLSATRVAV